MAFPTVLRFSSTSPDLADVIVRVRDAATNEEKSRISAGIPPIVNGKYEVSLTDLRVVAGSTVVVTVQTVAIDESTSAEVASAPFVEPITDPTGLELI